jgi:hypothetical protein
MESRIRILRWLRLLLLSAGLAGRWRHTTQYTWFRQCEMPPGNTKSKLPNTNKIKLINNTKMESRLRILHWLSLLLLSAGLAGGPCGRSPDAWFRRHRQLISRKLRRKRKQESQYSSNPTMKRNLKILRWLSLHTLSANRVRQLQAMAFASWFRRKRAAVFILQTLFSKTSNKNIETNNIKYKIS